MSQAFGDIPSELWADLERLYEYNQLHHELRPCSVGIGLGSHDLDVATYTAQLFHQGLFPIIVFTSANAPTTVDRFPRGEAVHYKEQAIAEGVPAEAIFIESKARNTGENVTLTRELLANMGLNPHSLLVVSRPYQQRRAFATFKQSWPDPEIVCASRPQPLRDYVRTVGDPRMVIEMITGDTERVLSYAELGFAIHQNIDPATLAAYRRLIGAGFVRRRLNTLPTPHTEPPAS